tara:strand:+ start:47 stop:418 length:372 start_codon:yes stop_codon:yes gene_type:complete
MYFTRNSVNKIKAAVKEALKSKDMEIDFMKIDFEDNDVTVDMFHKETVVVCPINDKYQITCYPGDLCITYRVLMYVSPGKFYRPRKTMFIHSKNLEYDLKQIKRLTSMMDLTRSECCEHPRQN